MRLATASFAYPDVGNADRAALAARLVDAPVPDGTFVLSTCLRVEVAVAADGDTVREVVRAMFGDVLDLTTVRTGESAIVHLYRVASGLESPIVGERDVLTQFRGAVARAEERHGVGGLFAKLLESAVAAAREVHRALPATPHESIAEVAADAVAPLGKVAVFGSGTMATAVAERLVAAGTDVTVVARSPERVAIRDVTVAPFDTAVEHLAVSPAVVSATSAKQALVADRALRDALRARTEPLTLVDMAMPPDFEPGPDAPVRYIDIDHLAAMVEPQPRVVAADGLACEAAIDMFHRLATHADVAPIISALMRDADDVVERTVARFAGRLGDERDAAVLRQAAHTVARTLLAGPVAHLRRGELNDEAVDGLATAFGVDDT
jgi:glutamyl-tRNA reductase